MPALPIDGRSIAQRIRDRVAHDIAIAGFTPGLGVVTVGDDPASHIYLGLKERACRAAGIHFERVAFPDVVSQDDVIAAVRAFNTRADIDGILVQLPLPQHLNESAIIAEIDPSKDADGFHPATLDALERNKPRMVPGLASAIEALIAATGENVHGSSALVIANSGVFFRPLATVLSTAGMVPAYAAPDAPDLAERARAAHVLIVAIGRANFITQSMVAPGAIIIDVGVNRTPDGTLVGDVSRETWDIAGHVSPVPGGVGPVTVAMLLANVLALAERRRR